MNEMCDIIVLIEFVVYNLSVRLGGQLYDWIKSSLLVFTAKQKKWD